MKIKVLYIKDATRSALLCSLAAIAPFVALLTLQNTHIYAIIREICAIVPKKLEFSLGYL